MSEQKTDRVFVLVLSVLIIVSLAGCRSGKDFPFYQMETREDYSEVLYIDGVPYSRDWNKDKDEQAFYFHRDDKYVWTPAEGIGEQIGVCGKDADKSASLNIYEIAGDEAHIFLYTWPAGFYFGGTEGRLWRQEGVTLNIPAAETVSSISIAPEKEDGISVRVEDAAMIAGLLELYNDDNAQTAVDFRNRDGWLMCSLIMHHRDFPFLQYRTRCCYAPEQSILYCEKGKSREWFAMPTEWAKVISEHVFFARGE